MQKLIATASIAALVALGAGVGEASAAKVLKVICTSGCAGSPFSFGPYSPGSIGVLQGVTHTQAGVTYDWTFTLAVGGTISTEMQAGAGSPFVPQSIQYSIWSGTPSAPGTNLGTSLFTPGATLKLSGLAPGDYFFQLKPSGEAVVGEQLAGSLTDVLLVPEPASWLMMVGGLALVGAGLRLRRHGPVAAAV